MIELVDKDIEITIVNMFHMFKKIEESMSMRFKPKWKSRGENTILEMKKYCKE